MAKRPYKKVVEYHFEVEGETFAVTDASAWHVCVEEVRKNGQEDTHMAGELRLEHGKFEWESGEHTFVTYGSEEIADGIREYLNKHGIPGLKKAKE